MGLLASGAAETSLGDSPLYRLGVLLLVAALLARLGRRFSVPTIPLYMAVGIFLGPSTPGPVLFEEPEDLALLASLGLVLLLFHLGVEFPMEQVRSSGNRLLLAAGACIGLNVAGGIGLGLVLGWGSKEALVIGGAMGISSSAIVTKLLIELRRLANAETPLILGIIVVEDLFLAGYLALLSPVLGGADTAGGIAADVGTSFGFLLLLILIARFGARAVSMLISSREDELLTIGFLGLVLVVAGTSADLGVSDAIGALMIGLVVSRTTMKDRVERLVLPLRDAFAALFFIVFGLQIDVDALGDVAGPALLAVVTTMLLTTVAGVVAARIYALNQRAAANIAMTVLGRGEFSLILATLGVAAGLDSRLGPFVALYVLVLAVLAPVLAGGSRFLARYLPDRLFAGDFTYVREEATSTTCTHLDQVLTSEPSSPVEDGCPACVALGLHWVHLRMCLTCGLVACCDDSESKHATAHFEETGHAIVSSMEPGEHWSWCYEDEALVTDSLASRGQRLTPSEE